MDKTVLKGGVVYNQAAMLSNINPKQKVPVVDLTKAAKNVIDKPSL